MEREESREMTEMEEQVEALTSLLEEGLVSQEKYDILVVKIMSGEMPDLLGDEEDTRPSRGHGHGDGHGDGYGHGDGHGDGHGYGHGGEGEDDDDRSMASRSSSLFNVHNDETDYLSSDEEDENLKSNIVTSNMGFSALYKQNSIVDLRDNPSEDLQPLGMPLPPLPPTEDQNSTSTHSLHKQKHLNMVMMGARPKSTKKKTLNSVGASAEAGGIKSKNSARRGFFRQTSSFEAAKYNPSLAANLKKNLFDIIMIDKREYPPPADAPAAGDIPLPPPLSLPVPGVGGGRVPPEVQASLEEKNTIVMPSGLGSETSPNKEYRESNGDRETSVTSMTSLSSDTSYKNRQFAMKPELLSAALKKRSQWTLNRHDSNEFYN
jgi:hypothetical protein